jgi:hypothetical protein
MLIGHMHLPLIHFPSGKSLRLHWALHIFTSQSRKAVASFNLTSTSTAVAFEATTAANSKNTKNISIFNYWIAMYFVERTILIWNNLTAHYILDVDIRIEDLQALYFVDFAYHSEPVVVLHQFLRVSKKFEKTVSFVKIWVQSSAWDFFPIYFYLFILSIFLPQLRCRDPYIFVREIQGFLF